MDFGLFKHLIDDIGDYVFLILLWDWGEPFLNPEVNDMIAYAKKKGIKLVSSTNGHLFTKEQHVDGVIRSGLDSLIIALDGANQETYARYRQGGDVDKVIQAARNIVNRKRELKVSHPFINIRTVVMRHNEREIPQIKKLVQDIGVDALTLKTFNPYDSDEALVPKNEAYRRFHYLADGKTRARRKRNPCRHLWNMPAIHWNGYVCMCTYDSHEAYIMGDLRKESFRRIWKGMDYWQMRKRFRDDWEEIDMCTGCSYAYEGGSCIDEIMAGAFFFTSHRP
jgi:radical SAM protein with 4Fe4S-binding SPASM domain